MNTSYPLVSIIVPAYNHEKYIKNTLDSIVNDTYPNKEIVIIDDGSTDNTNVIIEKWIQNCDELIIRYKSRENKGVTKTLNELIDLANGTYICGLASDDYLFDEGIKKRVEYLKKNSSKLAVIGDCTVVDSENNKIYDSCLIDYFKVNINNYKSDRLLKNEIIFRWAVAGPTFLAKKELYFKKDIEYNENLVGEDWDMALKLVSKGYLGFIDDIVGAYRLHNNNTCREFENEILKDRIKTAIINLKYFHFNDQIKLLYVMAKLSRVYLIKIFNRVIFKNG